MKHKSKEFINNTPSITFWTVVFPRLVGCHLGASDKIVETPLSRSNKWCVDDELLALVLQMIVSPTLNSLTQDLDLVERRFECKATLGRLEIKNHMVGMEYLGLNT